MTIRPSGAKALASTRGHDLLEFDVHDHHEHAHLTVIRLHGEVDHSNAWLVAALIEGATLCGATTVQLELRALRFADSSIVTAIEACRTTLDAAHAVVIVREPVDCVARVFHLLGATELLAAPAAEHVTRG